VFLYRYTPFVVTRKIIHCDADCFFAAIEMRDNPALRGRPMAVGGSSERRGVISTCNYEARQFGIHSAMASAQAKKLCPELIIVPGRMAAYREASQTMREIFHRYTDLVEPLSLDEAYLDVTAASACEGSATRIAQAIRQDVFQQLKITVSAGVSNSKFLAKVASDWRKPDGLFVIPPAQVEAFIETLPITKIHGVGKVTANKLQQLGIEHCGQLRRCELLELTQHFGAFGNRLYNFARGIDDREVKTSRLRKSLSVEHTYASDLESRDSCIEQLPNLLDELQTRLARVNNPPPVSKAFVKVKFSDFSTTTLERSGTQASLKDYQQLLGEALSRSEKSVRLLGLGVRFCLQHNHQQLDLFAAETPPHGYQ
jgi:DNA polymerase-4